MSLGPNSQLPKEMNISPSILAVAVPALLLQLLFRLFIVAAALGLSLELSSDAWLRSVISRFDLLPLFEPIFWLKAKSAYIALLCLLWLAWRAHRLLRQLEQNQVKQSLVLGGLRHYLVLQTARLPVERTPEHYPQNLTFFRMLSVWFTRSLMGDDFTDAVVTGTDPFEAAFTRGDDYVTILDDLKEGRAEHPTSR